MKRKLKRIIYLDSFSETLAENDLVNRQRFRLFRTATFISLFVYLGFLVQVFVVLPGNLPLLFCMFGLFAIAFINYLSLADHKKPTIAFTILLAIWFVLIHIDTYYSGGIRNSANFYLAVLILTGYMLLGNKGGKIMAAFSVLHIVYFYIVTTQTDWVTYDLVGDKPGLIDLYFFLSTTASMLVLTFQSGYIERNKNEIIADINLGKIKLEKSEEQLGLKNRELERKNRELEEFAYIASHDLQEPLKTSLGLAQMLQKKYHGKLDETADTYLSFMVESGNRMKTLIRDLLEYSRIGYVGNKTLIDCNEIVKEILGDISKLVIDTGATISYNDLPLITGYRTEVKLLIQNLVINAMKFKKQDTPPVITISSKKENGGWHFSITDNGIGIEKKDIDKIFIIFQRLHSQSEVRGSGIGLAHCKKIVELHNGTIWVDSEPLQGSTFHFTLNEMV